VLHQIGVGVLGPVFRTYEPTRDRLAAVKVFRLDLTPEQAQTLADELERLVDAGLSHPSIVAPIAAGVEGGMTYLAEEYVAGESLDIAIRHYAPAPLETALPFIAQLAGALDFARAAGLGHGTLHPRDIFLTPDEARATGFGIAGALEVVGQRPPVRRPYSAPERVAGEAWGAPADVFALGAIAYELLTGRRIAGALGPSDTLELRGADPLVARLLAGPLVRALAEAPGARYPGALAFARALEAAAEGEEERDVSAPAAGVPPAVESPKISPVQPSLVDALDERRDDVRLEEPSLLADVRLRDPEPPIESELLRDAEGTSEPAVEPERRLIPSPRPEQPILPSKAELDAEPELERELKPDRVLTLERELKLEPDLGEPGEPVEPGEPREPMRVLPLALMLVAGLLVGFVAGYAVGTRGQANGPGSAAVPTAGTAWSEAKVDPSPAATPPPPAPTAASRGTIVVRSTPGRAGVLLNGVWRGRTPLTLSDLALGKHTVRVTERGYATANREVMLSAERDREELDVTLAAARPPARTIRRDERSVPTPRPTPPPPAQRRTERAEPEESAPTSGPYTGSVYVDSRPRGARVFIDGRPVGTTPLQLSGLPIGSHVVRLELPNHRTWTASRRIVAGQTERVTGSLEPIR
jgi:serine/threonine protein kinase